jgi:ABC-2 type transport system permease protein
MFPLVRTEFTKAARRKRTLIISALLVALPSLIVFAINARGTGRGRDRGEGLFLLAQQSGLLVPAAVLSVMSGFLLVVIAGTLAGDSVAGDAAWGNLRYLLMRPVRRGRLLLAKAFVAGVLIWACTILVTVAALVAGAAIFAGGFQLDTTTLLLRTVIATGYVAFSLTALLALGTLFSTLTDTATSAIGASIGVYIVSQILDSITQFGVIRYAFPTHYLNDWQPMFTANTYPSDMLVGIGVQLAYLAIFGTAAVLWFRRKDIRS